MDAEILKFICANQGAVDADVLMFNLFPGASANEVISNKNNFVLYCLNGQQKVVARTGLKLCKIKDCPASCGHLHLCKNFLFSGLCPRRFCSFCHDMDSDYNRWLLKQHELDYLSRAELNTLLLQSDTALLPPICYEYNTGNDEFGRCQSGIACSRLHICKKYPNQDCRCSKIHDFCAPQPLKSLYDKGVPDTLICSLRSVYANREALRSFNSQSSAAPISTNATTEVGGNLAQRQKGRERRGNKGQFGHKGNSGSRGKPHQQQQTTSCSGILSNTDLSRKKGLREDDNVPQELNSSSSLSAAGNDTSAESTDKQKVKQRQRKRGGKSCKSKGSKGNEGNLENPLQQQTASNDVHANDDLYPNMEAINGDKQQQDPNSPNCDIAVDKHTDAKNDNGSDVPQKQRNQDTEKGGSRQNKAKLENPLLQQKTASLNDVLASEALDLNIEATNETDKWQQDLDLPTRNFSVVEDKSNNGFNVDQRQWNLETGVNVANVGKSLQQQQTSTLDDALASIGSLDLHNKDGLKKVDIQEQQTAKTPSSSLGANSALHLNTEKGLKRDQQQQDPNSPNRDASAFCVGVFAKSNSGFNVAQSQWNQGTEVNWGNAGKSLQQQQTSTLDDALAKFGSLDLLNKDELKVENQKLGLKPSKINVSADGKDTDVSNSSGQSTQQVDVKQSSASGRGNKQDDQQLHRSCSTHVSAAAIKDGNVGDVQKTKLNPVKDTIEICVYNITGDCEHENQCDKAHLKMPYKWQVLLDDFWTSLPQNETIEKDYCDPKKTYSFSSNPPIYFDTMTCGQNKVRRLSTPNSLVEPDLLHTTEWLWYWQDEFGKWNLYGSYTRGHGSADITSSKLEQKFLNNDKDVVDFTAGSQPYSLSFQDMKQTNKRYSTKKSVTRRPLFVSAEDVKTKKMRKSPNSTSVPDNWDITQILPTGFLKVTLQPTSEEYLKIAALFYSTMWKFKIFNIERIQNKALWEVFQWQKNLMKNKNGGCDVAEKQLFHGTDSEYVDDICSDNFDWRICGIHGTVYGKGSYFARDASYSHAYTGNTNVRSMFIARVLVGSYTKGDPSYVKPPFKDGRNKIFYDSCTDNVIDPSIFVVFEKLQIYPEYLIQYTTTTNPVGDIVSPAQPTNQCVIA